MANSTQPVDTQSRDGVHTPLALAVQKVYKGCAAAIVIGTGYGTPLVASSTSTQQFVGIFTETYDNTAGTAGGYFTVIQRDGAFQFAQTGTTIAAANIGSPVYFSDDHTVTLTAGTIYAGVVIAIDANGAVWVSIGPAVKQVEQFGPLVIYTQAAAATITNVAGAAQVFASASIPANLLIAGDRIRVRGQLVGVTRTSSDTTALSLNENTSSAAGGTSLFTLAAAFAHATTNFLFFDVELVVQSIGASGAVLGGGIVNGGTAGATTTGLNVGSTTVATNAVLWIVLNGTFSASNTTDQVGVNVFDLDVIRA